MDLKKDAKTGIYTDAKNEELAIIYKDGFCYISNSYDLISEGPPRSRKDLWLSIEDEHGICTFRPQRNPTGCAQYIYDIPQSFF